MRATTAAHPAGPGFPPHLPPACGTGFPTRTTPPLTSRQRTCHRICQTGPAHREPLQIRFPVYHLSSVNPSNCKSAARTAATNRLIFPASLIPGDCSTPPLTSTAAGCTLAGWVANKLPPATECAQENINYLKSRLSVPLLGVLPIMPVVSAAAVAENLLLARLPHHDDE